MARFKFMWPIVVFATVSALPYTGRVFAQPISETVEISSGPMVGYSAHHEVAIWVRMTRPTTIRIRYWSADKPNQRISTPPQKTAGEDKKIAHVLVRELMPGTRYEFEVLVGKTSPQVVARDYPLRFQTQVLWQRRSNPPPFVVALGSCAYTNDPEYEAPKKKLYGGGYEIYEAIRKTKPDLMLWLGDNIYLRPVDSSSRSGIFRRYSRSRALPAVQALLGSVHHYAIWDDHDYGPNDANWSYVLKGDALDAFRTYWANPSYGLPDLPGVFGQFSWGDIDFFLTDNRYYRSASNGPRTRKKTVLGRRQFEWLLDALSASRAPFKIVLGGGQFLSPFDRFEGYAQAPHEQRRLITSIVKRRIPGVVFISGDRHHSELVKITPDKSYPLYDFTSSPLTSRGASASHELESDVRVPGTLVRKKRNFGLLRFDGPKRNRRLIMESRDGKGELLWSHTIHAKELKPSRRRRKGKTK